MAATCRNGRPARIWTSSWHRSFFGSIQCPATPARPLGLSDRCPAGRRRARRLDAAASHIHGRSPGLPVEADQSLPLWRKAPHGRFSWAAESGVTANGGHGAFACMNSAATSRFIIRCRRVTRPPISMISLPCPGQSTSRCTSPTKAAGRTCNQFSGRTRTAPTSTHAARTATCPPSLRLAERQGFPEEARHLEYFSGSRGSGIRKPPRFTLKLIRSEITLEVPADRSATDCPDRKRHCH